MIVVSLSCLVAMFHIASGIRGTRLRTRIGFEHGCEHRCLKTAKTYMCGLTGTTPSCMEASKPFCKHFCPKFFLEVKANAKTTEKCPKSCRKIGGLLCPKKANKQDCERGVNRFCAEFCQTRKTVSGKSTRASDEDCQRTCKKHYKEVCFPISGCIKKEYQKCECQKSSSKANEKHKKAPKECKEICTKVPRVKCVNGTCKEYFIDSCIQKCDMSEDNGK